MTEFHKGDRVRVTFEAEVGPDPYDGTNRLVVDEGCRQFSVPLVGVELIERVDDPANDPVGTVRSGETWPVVKIGPDQWVTVWPGRLNDDVRVFTDTDIRTIRTARVDFVAGTPADQAWREGEPPIAEPKLRTLVDGEGDTWYEYPSGKWGSVDDYDADGSWGFELDVIESTCDGYVFTGFWDGPAV